MAPEPTKLTRTILLLILAVIGCSGALPSDPDGDDGSGGLQITPRNAVLGLGATKQFSVRWVGTQACENIDWRSENEDVLSVAKNGKVTAKRVGAATLIALCGTTSGAASVQVVKDVGSAVPMRAFPEAAGWGAGALSTCNRSVLEIRRVRTLADGGDGSLRWAIEESHSDRLTLVVFDVGGYIDLRSGIEVKRGCLYVAGQTAPGDGITVRAPDMTAFVLRSRAHDVVFRYLRIRNGTNQPGVNTGGQGLIVGSGPNVVVDHVSFSWASDQLLSIYGYRESNGWGPIHSISVQYSLFAEPFASSPVCYSAKGNTEGGGDGIPQWYEVEKISLHHNAALHCSHRAPYVGAREAEVVNNVVYNWGQGAMHTDFKPWVDFVGNYFKRGPMNRSLSTTFAYEISHDFRGNRPDATLPQYMAIGPTHLTWDGRAAPGLYLAGNHGPHLDNSSDQWAMTSKYKNNEDLPEAYYHGVEYGSVGLLPRTVAGVSLVREFPLTPAPTPVPVGSAQEAWNRLIEQGNVGASHRIDCSGLWVRAADEVDRRVLQEAQAGTGVGSPPSHPSEAGGYPPLSGGSACDDADTDGLPDEFEQRFGLDPENPGDTFADPDGDGWTAIEEYLNGSSPVAAG